ncbi:MAG: cysteine desulfurase family protein [Cytophagales bacterium]
MSDKTRIYLDNAATTPMHPEVVEVMTEIMKSEFGNPSSIHFMGLRAKALIEKCRRTVATALNASPAEIFFTSGATESLNTVIRSLAEYQKIKHIITSPIEHHAVLHTVEHVQKLYGTSVTFVKLNEKGEVILEDLEQQLKLYDNVLVCLMHANNEIGNLSPVEKIASLCRQEDAFFLCDTVQTLGLYPIDLQQFNADAIVGSAHKFYGPKGIGFLYLRNPIDPFIFGGAQERNFRGGTENLIGIVGLAKALDLFVKEQEHRFIQLQKLKSHFLNLVQQEIPEVQINGVGLGELCSPKIINLSFPNSHIDDLLLFKLDIEGLDASGGSACSSGSQIGSHVLNALNPGSETTTIRFSFGMFNTIEEIERSVMILKKCYQSL